MNNILHVTTHGGKMLGIPSISSSCQLNQHCAKRAKNEHCICHFCYASLLTRQREALRNALAANHEMLNSGLLPASAFPRLNALWARIESFGDVASTTHARNFIGLCRANPKTTFAAWTKNLGYWRNAIKLDGKPRNFVLVYSSPIVGKVTKLADADRRIVDHVFSVMPKGTPAEKINCGARSCLNCLRCYRRDTGLNVYELLK